MINSPVSSRTTGNKTLRLVFASVLLASLCHGIEPGFYGASEHTSALDGVFAAVKAADRVIRFGADLQCDLGLGTVRDGIRHPILLKRDEVADFLKKEKHKGLLVVWCEKTVMWNDKKAEQTAAIKTFALSLGYDRVLLLGAHGSGVHVIEDVSPPKPKQVAAPHDH
jgi:hypothetical protein